jgi:hypothetical protein
LKKAIQLSKLTNARVMLKVYHEEDGSLIEYYSDGTSQDFDALNSSNVDEYSKFTNKHYDLLAQVEEKINKNGFTSNFVKNDL